MRWGYKYGCDPQPSGSFRLLAKAGIAGCCPGTRGMQTHHPGCHHGSPSRAVLAACLLTCQVLMPFHSIKGNVMCRGATGLKLGPSAEPAGPARSAGGNSVLRQNRLPQRRCRGGCGDAGWAAVQRGCLLLLCPSHPALKGWRGCGEWAGVGDNRECRAGDGAGAPERWAPLR